MVVVERIPTGIMGLDKKMQGGLVRNSVNLVTGKAGTGKTSFCMSFLLEGAKKGEPGIYVTTEQNEKDLKDDIEATFGWKIDEYEKKKLIKFISIKPSLPSRAVSEDKLAQLIKLYMYGISNKVQAAVKRTKAKRVVVDSISVIEMFIKDEYFAKAALMQFVDTLRAIGVTSLLSGTVPETTEALSGKGIIEYIVDCIVKLNFIPVTEEFKRTIMIRKMRRTDHSTLVHPFEITKSGLKVVNVKNI